MSDLYRKLRIPRPDDFHHHARDGSVLGDVLQHTAKQFRRAIIMPNLKPPVRTLDDALAYKERILSHTQTNFPNFLPLMTLYLTDTTTSEEIERSFASGHVFAVKYYPAGATTNSDFGVTNIERVYPVLETMARIGMPLLIHGEVTDSEVDVFDREKEFLETILKPLVKRLPSLKIVAEHVTTAEMAAYVTSGEAPNLAATITAHHLLYNRNDIFRGGVSPHMYCLPILKRERHRKALLSAVASGCPRFFIGTDSAPHAVSAKESSCGCAGIFTAHAAIELYAEAFASVDALDRLEDFACRFGAEFYGLPVCNDDHIELIEESWTVPESYSFGEAIVRPLRAGQEIRWRIDSN